MNLTAAGFLRGREGRRGEGEKKICLRNYWTRRRPKKSSILLMSFKFKKKIKTILTECFFVPRSKHSLSIPTVLKTSKKKNLF